METKQSGGLTREEIILSPGMQSPLFNRPVRGEVTSILCKYTNLVLLTQP